VAGTKETLVLENATKDQRLGRDEYVQTNRLLSAACLPIMAQGELRGLIYLENNSRPGVFTAERVGLMQILSSQIGISLENARLYQQQGEAVRMQNELITAHAVQEMLFPTPLFESQGVKISGYYQPASECGGDWWGHSKIGDWTYVWIGDATGHGAPAALVTSAACSTVALLESDPSMTPEKAMSFLNNAICRTTKGQITMTFFVGALNGLTGEFRFARASHEAPLLLRKEKMLSDAGLRSVLEPLMGTNGASLGEAPGAVYTSESIQLKAGDTIVFYTDGLPEMVNKDGKLWGERGFWESVRAACSNAESVKASSDAIIEKVQGFRGQAELNDDITLCVLQFTGEDVELGPHLKLTA
jgi:phosphoserine phosphatase RsbU/P